MIQNPVTATIYLKKNSKGFRYLKMIEIGLI